MELMLAFRFNPQQVAYYEASGWRAYYDRRWLRLLALITRLCQEQFAIPFPASLRAGYYVGPLRPPGRRLTITPRWCAPITNDFIAWPGAIPGYIFDPAAAAALELQYNEEHRRLVGHPDKSSFVEAMVKLHCELFGLTPAQARPSAELRVLANNTVDLITGKTSTDVEADWARLEVYLCECYRSIQQEMENSPMHPVLTPEVSPHL